MLKKLFAVAASAAAALCLTLAAAGSASANPTVLTANTSLTNYPAWGNNSLGNDVWATDTLSRAATLTDNGTDSSDPTRTDYTLHVADTGTFVTPGDAGNPNGGQATDPTDATDGSVTGAIDESFAVDSSVTPSTSGVPATMNGSAISAVFFRWGGLFFPMGTKLFYSAASYTDTYNDSKTCETWVFSSSNHQGTASGAGGISGDGTCTLSVTNPGTLTATPGKPFSKQITASTGSSAGGLTYAFTGLPKDGLSGSASGLISGTPASPAVITVTVTVKDAVGDNCPANTDPPPSPAPVGIAVPVAFVTSPEDDNGSCSTTFKIDVGTTPAATTSPTPPSTTGTTTPVGGVQTGGGQPASTSFPWLPAGAAGLMLLLSGAAYAPRRQRQRG